MLAEAGCGGDDDEDGGIATLVVARRGSKNVGFLRIGTRFAMAGAAGRCLTGCARVLPASLSPAPVIFLAPASEALSSAG
jgi:hypothetical protein